MRKSGVGVTVTRGFIDPATGVMVPNGRTLDIVAEMRKLARGAETMLGVAEYAAKHYLESHKAATRRKAVIRRAHRCGNLIQFPRMAIG
jgi:citrate lyase beta subunit